MALRTSLVAQPHLYMGDTTGRPLDAGKVYFGQPNKDPEFYPINVFYDEALTIAAPQPIRTKGGFMNANGQMAEVYAAETEYSVKVLDGYNRQVFYQESVSSLNQSTSVVTKLPYFGAVNRNQNEKNSDIRSIKDFGAVANANSTEAINNATAAGIAFVPDGNYIAAASVDRSKLFGTGSVNGVKVGFDFNKTKSLTDFGDIIGNDATAVLEVAIAACKLGGEFSGHALLIPPKEFVITKNIVIDEPIAIVGQTEFAGRAWSDKAPTLRFTKGGFVFSETGGGGYHYFRNLSLKGVVSGVTNLPSNNFGNTALKFNAKANGIFENIVIQGFDTSVGSYKAADSVWGGAYRYFNYCTFYNSTNHLVQQGYTTDMNFFQCDFRDRDNQAGYIIIDGSLSSNPDAYATANFVDCMFESIGGSSFSDHTKYGIQLYGHTIMKVSGGYTEEASVYVSKDASFVSTANIKLGSSSERHVGSGFIDLSGAFAHAKPLRMPDLDNETSWSYTGVSVPTIEKSDGVSAFRFQVLAGAGAYPQINPIDFPLFFKNSMTAFSATAKRTLLQVSFEYKAKAGASILINGVKSEQGTWGMTPHDANNSGWKRLTFCLPHYGTTRITEVFPVFVFTGLAVGDYVFFRKAEINVLSD